MISLKNNIHKIIQEIKSAAEHSKIDSDQIRLIAVSKKKEVKLLQNAIENGVTDLGENYIQEAVKKIDIIGKDAVTWHFIGHLQSNKAKLAVNYFDYIHTVDSLKLAKQINNQALKIDKIQKILIQVNISHEESKSGANAMEAIELAQEINNMQNLSLEGLMGMPPYSYDPESSRPYFKKLTDIKSRIKDLNLENVNNYNLSMGMSHDFKIAIQEGATMVRIGTSIFGQRL